MLIYTLAAIYRKENGFDDCLLINEKNALVESVSSNLFIVKNKVLFTPPLDDGCVEGIMRKQIIKISRKLNYKVIDNKSLFPDDLIQADEVFLTNAIRGVSWVVAYKEKRFFNTTSKTLIRELNVSNFIK